MAIKKDDSAQVTVTIDEGTTIVIEEVEYYGTVTVDEAIANALISTGKVNNDATRNA